MAGADVLPVRARMTLLERADRLAAALERHGTLWLALLSALYWAITIPFALRKLLWNDELYTYYIATLPTMHDVWNALLARGEQMPPLFYLPTRIALSLFGEGHLTVRLPEMLGFWLMIGCVYVIVRRRASAFPALCAAAFPLVTLAYYYAFEARPYALVLGFSALSLLCWQTASLERRRALAIVGLAASLMLTVSLHYYGVLLLGPLAAGEAARTLAQRRLDVPVWIALAVSVVPLAFHAPLIRTGASYAGAFWSPPQWINIPDFYADILATAVVPAAAVAALTVVHFVVRGDDSAVRADAWPSPRAVLPAHEAVAVFALAAMPFVCVVLAKALTGAFVNRYALAAIVGMAVIAGSLTAMAFRRYPLMRLAAFACLTGWFVLGQAREYLEPTGSSVPVSRESVDRPAEWIGPLDPALPVVVADPHTFTVLSHYSPPALKARMVYLADPQIALARLGHNSVERGMVDLIRPWFRMNVREFEPFLAGHPRFLVYGDFVRLSFLNWMLPELHARGIRTELLHRGGDNLLLLASRDDRSAPDEGESTHPAPDGP